MTESQPIAGQIIADNEVPQDQENSMKQSLSWWLTMALMVVDHGIDFVALLDVQF